MAIYTFTIKNNFTRGKELDHHLLDVEGSLKSSLSAHIFKKVTLLMMYYVLGSVLVSQSLQQPWKLPLFALLRKPFCLRPPSWERPEPEFELVSIYFQSLRDTR